MRPSPLKSAMSSTRKRSRPRTRSRRRRPNRWPTAAPCRRCVVLSSISRSDARSPGAQGRDRAEPTRTRRVPRRRRRRRDRPPPPVRSHRASHRRAVRRTAASPERLVGGRHVLVDHGDAPGLEFPGRVPAAARVLYPNPGGSGGATSTSINGPMLPVETCFVDTARGGGCFAGKIGDDELGAE